MSDIKFSFDIFLFEFFNYVINFFMAILVSDEKLLWVLLRMPNWGFLVCNESFLSCCFWCPLYICLLVVWFLMCLSVHQFAFIIVQFIQLLGFLWFMVFIKFGEFGAIIFSNILSFFLLSLWISETVIM